MGDNRIHERLKYTLDKNNNLGQKSFKSLKTSYQTERSLNFQEYFLSSQSLNIDKELDAKFI